MDRAERVDRAAAFLYERFARNLGPFGKSSRLWADAADNQLEIWRKVASELLDQIDNPQHTP